MLEVTLLGCGGGMPLPTRYLSAILLQYKGRKILIDCGEGTQVSMREINSGFKSIDIICITHIHGDHIIGLPGILGTIGNSGRQQPLYIIGPEGIKEAVAAARVIAKYLPYEVIVIENPQTSIEGLTDQLKGQVVIETLEVEHSSPCLAYKIYIKRQPKFDVEKAIMNQVPRLLWNRLQQGEDIIEYEGVTYVKEMVLGKQRKGIQVTVVTDTRPINQIIPFIQKSDLFICEGTYGSLTDIDKAIKKKHMTFEEAATLAKKAEVDQLLLTHFGAAMTDPADYKENATSIFEQTIIGEDHYSIQLNFKD